ncbi:MAG: GNAT family N-acetyltransferase [Candidatus Thermoplasmatota archaeon]|nr:GNAT family N-acetyltransferase [Candidatus Thermoplasmatota archaeon]
MTGHEHLRLEKVTTPERSWAEMEIRRKVFIEEQNVTPELEYDDHESDSVHYILTRNSTPIGCARYRRVGNSVKLERVALLKEERGKGYGRSIMDRMLEEVLPLEPETVYLHSQTAVAGFYEKCGFTTCNGVFKEADIDHVKMVLRDREMQR